MTRGSILHSSEDVAIGLLGWAGGILIGAVMFGSSVFNWHSPALQYVVFGAGTSALYIVWKKKGILESTVYALSFALYCAIPSHDLFFRTFLNASLFFLFTCISFHVLWGLVGSRLPFGKFILLGVAFALFELVKTGIMVLTFPSADMAIALLINTTLRGTLGMGVGAGIELGEFLSHLSLLHHHGYRRSLAKWVPRRFFRK